MPGSGVLIGVIGGSAWTAPYRLAMLVTSVTNVEAPVDVSSVTILCGSETKSPVKPYSAPAM